MKKQETNDQEINEYIEQDSQELGNGERSQEPIDTEVEESLEEKCETYRQGWQRALADYQNLQKETHEKRSQWIAMSEFQVLEEFIPVYNNFKKAFASKPAELSKDAENWAQGIEYIMKQFQSILSNHGIEEMTVVGEPFDPNKHDAMSEEESDEYDEGTIIREVETGYIKGETVLRPAKVVVAK